MGERVLGFSPMQGFVEFINKLDPKEAQTYVTGQGKDSALTEEGLAKIKKFTDDAARINEFQRIMLPIITAMLQKDVYRRGDADNPFRSQWQTGVPGSTAPATYVEGRNRYEDIVGQ